MKKVLLCLSMFMVLLCVGCDPKLSAIVEGEYISVKEQNNEYFTKAKYSIEEITKEEYDEAKGINVFIDASTRKNEEKRYLSIKLYIIPLEKEEYELVTIKDIEFREGTPHSYDGEYSFYINTILYQGNIAIALTENSNNGFYIEINTDKIRYYCSYQEEKNN